jgi:hypothetical protein
VDLLDGRHEGFDVEEVHRFGDVREARHLVHGVATVSGQLGYGVAQGPGGRTLQRALRRGEQRFVFAVDIQPRDGHFYMTVFESFGLGDVVEIEDDGQPDVPWQPTGFYASGYVVVWRPPERRGLCYDPEVLKWR